MEQRSSDELALAVRTLKWDDGEMLRDVRIVMWPPTKVAVDLPPGLVADIMSEYECRFEILGLPHPIASSGRNVDALGAMMVAISGIRALLAPYLPHLVFHTLRGDHGIPATAMWFPDPAENRYIEQLLEMEANHYMTLAKSPGRHLS